MFIIPSYKHFADYFSMGLSLNICSQAEVIIWADSLIQEIDYPSIWIIDLSTSKSKSKKDVLLTLNSVSGRRNAEISFRLLIAKLALVKPNLVLQNNRFFSAEDSKLFSQLHFLVREYKDMPDEIRGVIFSIYINMDFVEEDYLSGSEIKQDYQELLLAGKNHRAFVEKYSRSN